MAARDKRCIKCKIEFDGDIIIGCDGECEGWYHIKCAQIKQSQYDVIKTCKGLKWFCDSCYSESEVKVNDTLLEIKRSVEKINSVLKINNDNHDYGKLEARSFADVAKTQIPHTLFVKAKKGVIMPEKIREEVKKKINPVSLEVGIKSVKNYNNEGITITCDTTEDKEKLHEEMKKQLGNQFDVHVPKMHKKRIRVTGIQEDMNKEEIRQCILQQNKNLNLCDNCEINLKILKKKQYGYMAILELDNNSFSKIISAMRLKIRWSICAVYMCNNIYRCYKCLGYNHKSENCKNVDEAICGCCGKVKHDGKCDTAMNCVNCTRANQKFNLQLATNHTVYDQNCQVLKRHIEKQNNRIILDEKK